MDIRAYFPFTQAPIKNPKKSEVAKTEITPSATRALAKVFKVASLALGFQGALPAGYRTVFEYSPYNFPRIMQAVDTDSYVKQAFLRYKELLWKEGWDIVGQNNEAVDYLHERIHFMELAMGYPFQALLNDIGDSLVKFNNVFVAKARGDISQFFPKSLTSLKGPNPVVGYYIIPAETMQVLRDRHNKTILFRQNIFGVPQLAGQAYGGAELNNLPIFRPEQVIHFYLDRKPGRAFGTPFVAAALDDVVALRQIEEDVQNLIHRELFPLYKYKVGTEDKPAEPDEIDKAAAELANLRTEGGLVLPDRHDVEVVGSEKSALDATEYLKHFKERVAVGLGMSQAHLGISVADGTDSDNMDVMLYDKVKSYQKYLSSMIELTIFSELLLEGGFDPHLATKKGSDRCYFKFREIDLDSQIKIENHTLQKWTADLVTYDEARLKINEDAGDPDEDQLYTALTQRMMTPPGQATTRIYPKDQPKGVASGGTGVAPVKGGPGIDQLRAGPQGAKPTLAPPQMRNSRFGQTTGKMAGQGPPIDKARKGPKGSNPPNTVRKQVGNKSAPANQHGRSLSPNIKHSEVNLELLDEIVDLLEAEAKVPKAVPHYRKAEPYGANCGTCRFMNSDGTCQRVQGMVDPHHVCDLFTNVSPSDELS